MKKYLTLWLILLGLSNSLYAQQPENRCVHQTTAQPTFEQWLSQARQEKILQHARSESTAAATYYIPVVFHVLHKGEAIGEGANVSMAQIKSQIDVLNEDYNRRNADSTNTPNNFKQVAGVGNIYFQLADFDSLGQAMPEKGIVRHQRNKGSFELDELNQTIKPQTIWNPYKYLNVWIVDTLLVNGERYLGYAQFPWYSGLQGLSPTDGTRQTDGIIVVKRALGSYKKVQVPQLSPTYNFNLGRTLTHEIGHYLGLLHTFGGCNEAVDYCADTPQQSFQSSGCPTNTISCGGTPMVQNFLDYSYDACMNIFTKCQIERMRLVLEKSPMRKELLSSPAIILGNEDEILNAQITIYPNPTQKELRITKTEQLTIVKYQILNSLGQIVQQADFPPDETLALQLSQGLYLLQLQTTKGIVLKRFIVQ